MRMLMLSAASLALAASAVYADPGKGGGGGHGGGNGGGHAAAADPGHGHGNGGGNGNGGGGEAKGNGGGHGPAASHGQGGGMKAERASPAAHRDAHGSGNGKAAHQAEQHRAAARDDHGSAKGNGSAHRDEDAREAFRDNRRDTIDSRDGRGTRVVRTVVHFDRDASRGLIEGCPPGLAKKHNGCMPPGLAQQRNQAYYRPSWFGYPSLDDGRYAYDDGYLYRTSNTGSILGYIPLLGGALSVGNPWPSYYDPTPVPDYYADYYNLGAPNSYRYADNVLYRVDPQNDAITSIAALLTGDQFNVGQRMPAGYDIYNVPYAYRDQYYDTPQADYRYADGYIYQVDPTTQLVQAAIQLLT